MKTMMKIMVVEEEIINKSNMKFKITAIALLISIAGFSQNKIWTLQECVDHAYENNITIKQGQNSLLINEQDIEAAKGNLLPSLRGSASQNLSLGSIELFPGSFANRTFHSTNVGLSVSQNVYSGNRNKLLLEQSKLNYERNLLNQDKIKDDIGLFVVNSYLNILFAAENLETAKSQYEFSQKQLQQVKELVDAGVQPQANVYDAEATLANDEQSVTIAENNYELALLSLAQLLQLPLEGFQVQIVNVGTPSQSIMYSDVQPVLDQAFENRSEIKIAETDIENAKLNTEIAKTGYLPTVTFGYGFNSGANFSNLSSSNSFFQQINDNKGHSFNLSVGIPIFSRFQNKTAVAKSKIQEENTALSLEQAKLDLESTIQRAYTDAQAALKTYVAAQKSLTSQQLAFDNAQERYNIGAMNAFDLEQTRIRLINAEASLINAKYDFVFKTKVLDFYTGKPITLD
jgi:outer membrane protein